jgi:hypothetical protein
MLPLLAAAITSITVAPAPPPPDCAPPQVKTLQPAERPQVQQTTKLPDALEIRAVLRSVNGCQYQDVIRFSVTEPGPYFPSGTLAPVGGGAIDRAVPTGRQRGH